MRSHCKRDEKLKKKKDNPNLYEFVHLFVGRLTKNYNENKKA